MATLEKHPIDYDALNKGDVIPVSKLEHIVSLPRTHRNFSFRVMAFVDRLEKELKDRGRVWTISTDHGDVRILDDWEASKYNSLHSNRARRKQRRCFYRYSGVSVDGFTDEQRAEHERCVEVDGKYIQAQTLVAKTLKLENHKRNVPGLPSAPVAEGPIRTES